MALRLVLLTAIAAALAVPTAATAGGWATVGFEPPPDDLAAGQPWQVDVTVLQHGRTPLEGVRPRFILTPEGGGEAKYFPARRTDEPGVYRATVVFESPGTWRYVVDDGFTAQHRFPPVTIGKGSAAEPVAVASTAAVAPASGGDDGPDYLLALVAAAVAALVAGLAAAVVQRRGGGASHAGG
jgi:YtkA-like